VIVLHSAAFEACFQLVEILCTVQNSGWAVPKSGAENFYVYKILVM